MKKPLLILGALLVAVVVAGLIGRSPMVSSSEDAATSGVTSDLAAVEPATEPATERAASGESAGKSAPTTDVGEPSVIRTGEVQITSTTMGRDLARVRAIASGLKGEVTAEDSHSGDEHTHAQLVLRVPNAAFDNAMDQIQDIGSVTHRSVSTEDVSTQVIDVDSRVRAQRASVASLEKLMTRARTVGEVMSVERELSQRQAELDSLLQQQRYLSDQTSMSTISVSMSSEQPEDVEDSETGFGPGLKAGWSALATFLTGAATVAGMLLPFVPLMLLVGMPAWWLVRRMRRRGVAAG